MATRQKLAKTPSGSGSGSKIEAAKGKLGVMIVGMGAEHNNRTRSKQELHQKTAALGLKLVLFRWPLRGGQWIRICDLVRSCLAHRRVGRSLRHQFRFRLGV